MIELRSDTFTLPSPEMIQAISHATLGDDVYGEDPTVSRLERLAAETSGKQAACLMPSGTMANLASILVHAPRGAKVLLGDESDIYLYEAGGASVLGGVTLDPISTQPDGRLLTSDLAAAFPDDPADPQFALPALICLENTHNRCGGTILPPDYLAEVRRFADDHQVAVHLDGARIFNAAVGSGLSVADIAAHADSVQFCLSKGLGAPIGSLVAGSTEFIQRVRRIRKMLGGGMRQAGIIAAAGIPAIRNAARLIDDHRMATRFGRGLAAINGVELCAEVQTNIVLFRVAGGRNGWQHFLTEALSAGLAVSEFGHGRLRAVFHNGITEADVDAAIRIVRRVLGADLPVTAAAPVREG